MGKLFEAIKKLIHQGDYRLSRHALDRLQDRRIMEWQIIDGVDRAALIRERHDAIPHATIELLQSLPDGQECKVVWSLLPGGKVCNLVTVHYFDEQN